MAAKRQCRKPSDTPVGAVFAQLAFLAEDLLAARALRAFASAARRFSSTARSVIFLRGRFAAAGFADALALATRGRRVVLAGAAAGADAEGIDGRRPRRGAWDARTSSCR